MAKVGEAYVELFAKMDKLKSGLGKAGNMVKRGMAKMSRAVRSFARATQVAMQKARMAVFALAGAIAGVLYLTAQQETAEAKLAAAMKASGYAAGFTTKEMIKMAGALQMITSEGDEAIMGAQAILSTFVNIRGRQFVEAMEVIGDMKTLFDTDMKGAAIQLGKALNDPIIGMSALNRVGVSFTETEKKMIKEMVGMNQIVEAQTMMLDVLRSQGIEGIAKAYSQTLGGKLKLIKGLLGDLVQAFGKAATAGVPWENLIGRIVKATQWVTANKAEISKAVLAIGKIVVRIVQAIVSTMVGLYTIIKKIVAAIKGMSGGMTDKWAKRILAGGEPGFAATTGATLKYERAREHMATGGEAGRAEREAAGAGANLRKVLGPGYEELIDSYGKFANAMIADSQKVVDGFKDQADAAGTLRDTIIELEEGAEEKFRGRGRGIASKFFTTIGRADIAKKLEMRQAFNEQMKYLDEMETKFRNAGKWTHRLAQDFGVLRDALLLTAEAEQKAIADQNRGNMTTLAAGFSERFGGLKNIRLDTGFRSGSMRTGASENTAQQQLTTLTQIRDILEMAGSMQTSMLPE